jgi:DNA-binding response OmpR family regulator
MRVLIAEDDPVSRELLDATLQGWGYETVVCADGLDAVRRLEERDPPGVAILDWMMPGMDAPDICRRVRQRPDTAPAVYLILLTSKTDSDSLVAGLEAGADEFMSKPFDPSALRARTRVGFRIVELQQALTLRVTELEAALSRVRQLQGLLPICAYCKKVRDDGNYWHQVESYISDHTDVRFSHGICPECLAQAHKEMDEREAAQESGTP